MKEDQEEQLLTLPEPKYSPMVEQTKTLFTSLELYELKEKSSDFLLPAPQEKDWFNDSLNPLYISKFSGTPYWPKSMPYPTMQNAPAKLFVQLNFEQLSTLGHLHQDMPKSGILQIFIAQDDDMWGLRFDGEKNQQIYIFHDTLLDSQDLVQTPQMLQAANNNDQMPGEYCCGFKVKISSEMLGLSDEVAIEKFYPPGFKDEMSDEMSDYMCDEMPNCGSKVGGYAYFTQYDHRDPKENWILLLQLDSDDHIMFGDSGVANWSITPQDLKEKNFKDLSFNWDCC